MATTSINLADLDGSNGFRVDVEAGSSLYSVSNAGDVNGDGFDDVMVSLDRASVYVVLGESTGFDATMNLTDLDGGDGSRLWGGGRFAEISDAGDVNGDGFDDVIVSSSSKGTNVVFGKAEGFGAAMDVSTLDGGNGFHLDGVIRTVSNAGDVNGDGFDDVILGNRDADLNGSIFDDEGSSYVVFGKASGFDATMDVFSLDGSNGFRLNGVFRGDESGTSVSAAGDVNGDGFDDVIISAPGANQYGSSYVLFGKAAGFDAVMNLSAVNGSNGFRLDMDEHDGSSVSNAGDVNGDGFDDVIVGFRVVFGKASGFGNRMNLSDLDGSNGFSLDEGSKLSPAGDVNGDGFDDLMVEDQYGSSYVAFGKASGFDVTVSLIPLNGSVSFVSGAGDVNGDGLDDLMAGTSKFGYVVFSSSDFTGSAAYLGTPGDDVRTGTPAAEIFYASDGDDTLIGGGGADTIRGGKGNDTIRVSDLDFLRIDGGRGSDFSDEENDTLGLDGSGINLDLTVVGDKITGIEIIDLSGTGDNTLTLTAADMLDLPRNANNTLMVKGNAGDQVVLDSGWVDRGFQGEFHMFSTQDEAVLMVADAVSTDFVNGGHMSLSGLDGGNGFRLDGGTENLFTVGFANSVSNAGDVNGDGFDDVIIGDRAGSKSYVVFGKASGFDATMSLSDLDGSNGFRLDSGAAYDSSGGSVSGAGDVNGDGFDDVIVGAYRADPNGSESGSSYVVFGRASGF
ncbi:integrin alpha, partial [uncultured Nitrosomonas sp.]|uniref:calcium-binding protein n=1 Tax=uncultured Nitrosomonas sp. TaxID=156424 RepID=UPI0025DB1CFF